MIAERIASVLAVAPSMDGGNGWSSYASSLTHHLSRGGLNVTLLTPGATVAPAQPSLPISLPALVPRSRGFLTRLVAQLPRIRRYLAAFDVIHIMAEPYLPVLLAAPKCVARIVTVHGTYAAIADLSPWPADWLYRQAMRSAWAITPSAYTAGRLAATRKPAPRSVVVRNGVDFGRFSSVRRARDRRRAGGPPTVLSVGAVKPRKGTLELVRSMAQVVAIFPDARCLVVGELERSEYVSTVTAEIDRLDLGGRVQLFGRVRNDELLRLYTIADVFALPSLNQGDSFEGFGLAHLEASAAGLPVVSTKGSGVEDAVLDGRTGILVPQAGVVPAMAKAIIDLLGDCVMRQRFADSGLVHARNLSWQRAAEETLLVYKNAAAMTRS